MSMPGAELEMEWPTPEFDRPDVLYSCSGCGEVVVPDRGHKQAALLIAGATIKLCSGCAEELRGVIDNA